MQEVPFQAKCHRITAQLRSFCKDRLANKTVSRITGLGKNAVKAIDKERLQEKYCNADGSWTIPEEKPYAIGIDEFSLHKGHQHATVVFSMVTGHVLYLAKGKKKQVVHDFIDFVGEDWMDNVELVCCDMNSDFQKAFEERCTHVQPVFDFFSISRGNSTARSSPRSGRTSIEGLWRKEKKEAASLKRSRFILTSS